MQAASDTILERLATLHPKLIDLSLDRVLGLLDKLGRPQAKLERVIHVAGTNGKGSTIATLRGLVEAMGLSVNVYTSPHLVRFHERIVLHSREIDEDLLCDVLARCEAANDGAPITQFEITTAAAFLAFAERPADVSLIEVGLGGEFDATNIFDQPAATLITPIDFDHREFLGHSLVEIAKAKAGILRSGVPALVGPQQDTALAVIEAKAARLNAPLSLHGRDWFAREEHGRLVVEDDNGLLDLSLPRLAGRHQIANAGLAVATVRQIWPDLREGQIEDGLRRVVWPARLQRLQAGPLVDALPKGAELWLDGAHNAAGARALAEALADMEERQSRPLYLIMGIGANKDPSEILPAFTGLARRLFAVAIPDHPCHEPDALVHYARRAAVPADPAPHPLGAMAQIASLGGGPPPRIVIAGSLYLAGEILRSHR